MGYYYSFANKEQQYFGKFTIFYILVIIHHVQLPPVSTQNNKKKSLMQWRIPQNCKGHCKAPSGRLLFEYQQRREA